MMNTAWATTYVPTAETIPCVSGSCSRCAHAAHTGAEDEAEQRAEAEQRGQRRTVVVAVGDEARRDRERDGEHQRHAAAGAERVPVEVRSRPADRRRTATAGRACPG